MTMAAAAMLAGCEFETPANGDLDGLWQLTRLDSAVSGVGRDMKASHEFWAVQMRLLQIQKPSGNRYYRFRHAGGRLTLMPPKLDDEGRQDTTVVHDYRVVTLTGGSMVLDDDTVRLSFRKY